MFIGKRANLYEYCVSKQPDFHLFARNEDDIEKYFLW